MRIFAGIGAVLLVLIVFIGLPWLVMGNEFFLAKYFNPKMEDVRRETFEHSNAYNRGMVQELDKMFLEYNNAGDEHKAAIASVVLHRYADYPEKDLPLHLRGFIQKLRNPK